MSVMKRDDALAVLREIKEDLGTKYGVLEIGVFGSVARDEAEEYSDVDVCVKTRTPNAFAIVHIKEELECLMRKKVDIVRIREKMNPYLRERIEKEGIYV